VLLREGKHVFKRDADPNRPMELEYAAASASEPSWCKVWVGDEMIEDCALGAHSLHTWWASNPLISTRGRWPEPGEAFTIEVGPNAVIRIEGSGYDLKR
jgi:hypothetical protein